MHINQFLEIIMLLALFASSQLQINIQLILLIYSCTLIYIGSMRSARATFSSIKNLPGGFKNANTQDRPESISAKEAAKIPLYGAFILVGLYIGVKYLSKQYVNYLLTAYFGFFSVASLKNWIYEWLAYLAGEDPNLVPPSLGLLDTLKRKGNKRDAYSLMLAGIMVSYYIIFNNWIISNVIAMSFCIFGIQQMALPSFKIGGGVLIGLFFYDIFFVFGTDVMITVAKNIEGPIKLLVPRETLQDGSKKFSMLGLGDIIIPGIYIALCLRYDIVKWINQAKGKDKDVLQKEVTDSQDSLQIAQFSDGDCLTRSSKGYFFSAIVGYILGLVVTVIVMVAFNHAQPALLYLVPGCLLSTLACAFVKGDIKNVWSHNEEKQIQQYAKKWNPVEKQKDD